jgi:superfamily I DNA/RNA helicase
MTRISDEQIRALRSLDINDRVLVSGVAGSGKTRLALWWAHQSARSGRNTFLSCYNVPLAKYLQNVSSDMPTLTVGAFLNKVSQFPGIPKLEEPTAREELDHFWNVEMIDHLIEFADQSEIKFDTIVLDEVQDFNDEWMEIIEKLLVDENSKILCVADPNQDLYDRGFFMPEGGSPWALAELRWNCRNTREIAAFVRQFGGGVPASASPEGDPIKFIEASSEEGLLNSVLAEIRQLIEIKNEKPENIVVITGSRKERDMFHAVNSPLFSFSSWDLRSERAIGCETPMRAKGIEADHVIFATLNEGIQNNEMYVGASRARTNLVIVGPKSFKERFSIA